MDRLTAKRRKMKKKLVTLQRQYKAAERTANRAIAQVADLGFQLEAVKQQLSEFNDRR